MKFELPKLPYEINALEPFISGKTMEFHHGKHHQAYITNLNNLIQGTKFENADIETIIVEADGPVLNNAAQTWNHTFFFSCLQPESVYNCRGPLADAINESFGTIVGFKDTFIKTGISLFGSGWVWLIKNSKGKLEILPENNAGNPLRKGLKPLLTCDVWEHSYYLDYQNRRLDYINAFWNLINWEAVEQRFMAGVAVENKEN
jgi:Fe-Mn family superoxide dismutase